MSITYKTYNQVIQFWTTIGRNIKKNQDFFIQSSLGLVSANLILLSIKQEVANKKQIEKTELYVKDLEMLSKEMLSDNWIDSIDEKLTASADKKATLKAEMIIMIKKCAATLPVYEAGAARPMNDDDDDVDEVAGKVPKLFPDDGGRII